MIYKNTAFKTEIKVLANTITVLLLSVQFANAQKAELNLSLNSGIYTFRGGGTMYENFFNTNSENTFGYANNPYGKQVTLSYGVSANIKHIADNNFLLGADFGFEVLRSKKNILAASRESAIGSSILTQNFINLYPFVGYRVDAKIVSIDFLLGLDFAYATSFKERDMVNGTSYERSVTTESGDFDYRPRAQVGLNYQRFGVYAGYSLGIIDYRKGLLSDPYPGAPSSDQSVRASFLRFGLSFRLY